MLPDNLSKYFEKKRKTFLNKPEVKKEVQKVEQDKENKEKQKMIAIKEKILNST